MKGTRKVIRAKIAEARARTAGRVTRKTFHVLALGAHKERREARWKQAISTPLGALTALRIGTGSRSEVVYVSPEAFAAMIGSRVALGPGL